MTQVKDTTGRAFTAHSGSTTAAVNWPDPIASGDRVILLCSGDLNGTNTFDPGAGWSALAAATGGGTGITFQAFEKDDLATGGESGTFNVTVNDTGVYNFITLAVGNTTGGAEIAQTTGTSSTTDPPSLSPSGGNGFYVQIAVGVIDLARVVSAWPPGFDEWVSSAGGANRLLSCERESTVTTVDPGTWSHASDGWAAATIAIPATAPDVGTFPQVDPADIATSDWTANSATQALSLPTVSAGDVILAAISSRSGGETVDDVDGFTELSQAAQGTDVRGSLWGRLADGTEGATVTATFSGVVQGCALAWPVTDAVLTDIEAATVAVGTTTTPDPPSLTPAGGSAEILWFSGFATRGTANMQRMPINHAAAVQQFRQSAGTTPTSVSGGLAAVEAASLDPDAGLVDPSSATVAYTVAVYPAASVPAAPTNPAATALSDSSIRITWDDVADETGYRVERSDDGIGGWADVSGNLPADTVSYDDTGLTASTQYFYRVFAFNAQGDSSPSTVVDATTEAASGNRMGSTGAIRKPPRTLR